LAPSVRAIRLRLLRKRKSRKGEYVCDCKAYQFPHRHSGGRCDGQEFVEEFWEGSWGSGVCSTCNSLEKEDYGMNCQVVSGTESPDNCRAYQEFIEINEIKVYQKRKR